MRCVTAWPSTLAVMILSFSNTQAQAPGERPEYVIYRARTPIVVDGRLDEMEWFGAPDVGRYSFPRYESGKKEQTVAKLLWDDQYLYAAFVAEDAHIWAVHTERDSQVWLDDAVEIFTSPDPERPNAYFNFEMNALGIFLDQFRFGGPDAREGPWNAEGVRIKTSIVGTLNDDTDEDAFWILEVAIPLENFAVATRNVPPLPGDVWLLNLNRLGGNTNPQASQWSPGGRNFHQPQYFGRVTFSEDLSPF